ncbi:hypothetical protein ANCCAN_22910 [Ancylostoma caninum]|uniref:Uncharacterized protein n=1 Tax=Ancylostoma caninum TaxID=29170 RepID=A0A368FGW1_ANCCA|nr:hypothetical protein ANCCAN_22910 [Ancylostoma caninum]
MAESLEDSDNNKEFGVNFSEKRTPWDGSMWETIKEILESWTRTESLRKMIHVNTTRIGCSYYIVPTRVTLNVICLYGTTPMEKAVSFENAAYVPLFLEEGHRRKRLVHHEDDYILL